MVIIICCQNIKDGIDFITQYQPNSKVFTLVMEMENNNQTMSTTTTTTTTLQSQITNTNLDKQKQFIVIDSSLFEIYKLADIRKQIFEYLDLENLEFLEGLIFIDIVKEIELINQLSLTLQIKLNKYVKLYCKAQEGRFLIRLENSDIIPYSKSTQIFRQFPQISLKENIVMYKEAQKRELAKNVKIYLLVGPSKVGKSTLVKEIGGVKIQFTLKNEFYKINIEGQEYVFIDTIGYQREWQKDLLLMKEIYSYTQSIIDNFQAKLNGILIFESISSDSLQIIYTFKLLQQFFDTTTLSKSSMIVGTKGNIIPANFQASRIESLHQQRLKLFGEHIPLINCQLSHISFGNYITIPKFEETKQEFFNNLQLLVPTVLQKREIMLYIISGNSQVGKSSFLNYLANKDIISLLQSQMGTLYRLTSNIFDNSKDYYFLETNGNIQSESKNQQQDQQQAKQQNIDFELLKFILETIIFLGKQEIDGFLFIDSLAVTKISVIDIINKFQEQYFKDDQNFTQNFITIALANYGKQFGNAGKFEFFKSYVSRKLRKIANTIMFENNEQNVNSLFELLKALKPLSKQIIQIIVESEMKTIQIGEQKNDLIQQVQKIVSNQDNLLGEFQCIIEHTMVILDEQLEIMLKQYVLQWENDKLFHNKLKDPKVFPLDNHIIKGKFEYDHFYGLISLKLQLSNGEAFPAQFKIQANKITSFKIMKKEKNYMTNINIEDTEYQNQFNETIKVNFIIRYLDWKLNLKRKQYNKKMILFNSQENNEGECDRQICSHINKLQLVKITNRIQAANWENDQLQALVERAKLICYLDCYVIIEDMDQIIHQDIIALKNIPNLSVFFTTYNLDKVQLRSRILINQLINIDNPSFEQRYQIIKKYELTEEINQYLQLLSFNFSYDTLNNLLYCINSKNIGLKDICLLTKQICKKDNITQLQSMSCIADQLIHQLQTYEIAKQTQTPQYTIQNKSIKKQNKHQLKVAQIQDQTSEDLKVQMNYHHETQIEEENKQANEENEDVKIEDESLEENKFESGKIKSNQTLMYEYSEVISNNSQQFVRYMFVNEKKKILEYHINDKLIQQPLNSNVFPLIELIKIAFQLRIDQIFTIETIEVSSKLLTYLQECSTYLIIVMLDFFKVNSIDQVINKIRSATEIHSKCRVAYVSRNKNILDKAMQVMNDSEE